MSCSPSVGSKRSNSPVDNSIETPLKLCRQETVVLEAPIDLTEETEEIMPVTPAANPSSQQYFKVSAEGKALIEKLYREYANMHSIIRVDCDTDLPRVSNEYDQEGEVPLVVLHREIMSHFVPLDSGSLSPPYSPTSPPYSAVSYASYMANA